MARPGSFSRPGTDPFCGRDRRILKKEISADSLRHTKATHLLDAGVPIAVVFRYLGRSNINTTMTFYGRKDLNIERVIHLS